MWIFLTPLLGHGFTLRWLLLTLASYPVFLLLYAKVMVAPRHHAPRYALGLIAMSLVLLPWYPSGLTYFVFGCVLLRVSGRGGWWQYLLQLTGLNLLFCSLALLFQYPWQSLVWIPAVSYIVGLVVNVEALNQQKDAALQLSQDEVRRLAATAERERIGRDLHDLLGHTLSLITLKLELARKLHDRGDGRARQEIGEAEAIAREALAQVRSAVTGIRASDLAGELASARLLLECQQVHLQYAPHRRCRWMSAWAGAGAARGRDQYRAPRTGDAGTRGVHAGGTHAGDADPRRWSWRRAGRGQWVVRHARTRGRPGWKPAGAVRKGRGYGADRARATGRRDHTAAARRAAVAGAGRCRMIRILLAEDQAMVRGALSALLGLEADIEVLGSAADGETAWRMLQQLQPDILVTDIEMPGLSGLELAQRIARHELPIKVVIVTTFARAGFLRRALEAGVLGYLLKDAPVENLAEALRKVKQGIRAIDPQLALDAWSQADPLTDRERRVLRLAGEGRTASEIAEQLGLSHGTVRNYLSECIGKLGVANRIEAYRLARQKGWL